MAFFHSKHFAIWVPFFLSVLILVNTKVCCLFEVSYTKIQLINIVSTRNIIAQEDHKSHCNYISVIVCFLSVSYTVVVGLRKVV